jgi:hypothetical protein
LSLEKGKRGLTRSRTMVLMLITAGITFPTATTTALRLTAPSTFAREKMLKIKKKVSDMTMLLIVLKEKLSNVI